MIEKKVSIGLPLYNAEIYIKKVLNNIIKQKYPNKEIIISDSFSQDRTESICKIYASKYKFIKYFRHKKKIDIFKNFNFVMQKSKGEYFTGKTPQDLPSQTLIKIKVQQSSNSALTTVTLNSTYSKLKSNKDYTVIQYYPTQPTLQDYTVGEFVRYFCKKTNELKYIEIDKNAYTSLANKNGQYDYNLYIPFYIHWQLTGNKQDVYNVNQNIVNLTMQRQKLYQFDNYLKEDYLKFFK
jgi:glycosyltransferase involved in cell wall biosynthesis